MKKNINSGQKQGQNNFSTSCRNGKDAGFTHQGNLRSRLIDSILFLLEKFYGRSASHSLQYSAQLSSSASSSLNNNPRSSQPTSGD
jgi:hypothetical protein